jgi:hypothetical protein
MAIDDQLAVLLARNADLFATYEEWSNGQIMLLAGSITDPASFNAQGGKTGALGYYPVVNVSGQTIYVPCMDRLRHAAIDGVSDALADVSIVGEGLLQKTGSIGEELKLSVPAASIAETIAGARTDVAVTPAGSKAAIAQGRIVNGLDLPAAVGNIRPQRYGGYPGPLFDSSDAINAAILEASITGLPVLLSEGDWYACNINVLSGVHLIGEGGRDKVSVIRNKPAFADFLCLLQIADGASDASIEGIEWNGGGDTTQNRSLIRLGSFSSNITFKDNRVINGLGTWALRGDVSLAPFDGLYITGNEFVNCPMGGSIILTTVKGSRTARINGNTYKRCGRNICSIRYNPPVDYEYDRWDAIFDVQGNNNVVTDCLNTGEAGPIPFEFWGCTGLQHLFNQLDSGNRGFAIGVANKNVEVAFNKIYNQTKYAFEAGLSRNVRVHHNDMRNCRTMLETTSPNNLAHDTIDLVIEDNIFNGTGLSAYAPGSPGDIIFVNGYAPGLRIRRNKISRPEFVRSGINLRITASVPTIAFSGAGTGALVSYTFKAQSVRVFTGAAGSGYTAPTVAVIGGGGTGMTITPTLANGKLTGGTITNPGTGYKTAPRLVVSDATGALGELEVLMAIEAITATGGTGYSAGTWAVSDAAYPGLAASGTYGVTSGAPNNFVVTNGGEGFGRVSDAIIEDPEILLNTYNSTPNAIGSSRGNITILRPKVKRTADLDAAHYLIAAGQPAVQISYPLHDSPDNDPQAVVEAPDCQMTGTVTGTSYAAVAVVTGARPMYGVDLRGAGKLAGGFTANPVTVNDSSGTARVSPWDVSGVSVTPYSLHVAIMRKQTCAVYDGTAAPTVGTYRAGDRVNNSAPTASSPILWQCTAGGTPGTWIARYGAGSDPLIPTAYTLLSALSAGQRLTAVGESGAGGNVFYIRCETLSGAQPPLGMELKWWSRQGDTPRGGKVEFAWGNSATATKDPIVRSTAIDSTNVATIVSQLDANGRRELVITFPADGAITLQLDAIGRFASNLASFSVRKS